MFSAAAVFLSFSAQACQIQTMDVSQCLWKWEKQYN